MAATQADIDKFNEDIMNKIFPVKEEREFILNYVAKYYSKQVEDDGKNLLMIGCGSNGKSVFKQILFDILYDAKVFPTVRINNNFVSIHNRVRDVNEIPEDFKNGYIVQMKSIFLANNYDGNYNQNMIRHDRKMMFENQEIYNNYKNAFKSILDQQVEKLKMTNFVFPVLASIQIV